MSNGCGPEWMPEIIKRALFNWFQKPHCDNHDAAYERGGNEWDRVNADNKFKADMKEDALAERGLWRLVRWPSVYIYYWLVKYFGSKQFNYLSTIGKK